MSEPRRIDLSKVKRKPKVRETRSFTDPLLVGEELVLTLQFPVFLHEAGEIGRRAQELCEFWRDPETLVTRLPPVDGVQTTLSDANAMAYAVLEKLQPEQVYDFRDFNQLSVFMPSALAAAAEWALSLLPNNDGVKRGLIMTTAGSPLSSSPSTQPGSIRPDLNGAISSPGASTSGSAPSAADLEERTLAELDASLMNPTGTG